MSSKYEGYITVLIKPQVYVYQIPPASNRGHKAGDWKLDQYMWTGRLRLIGKGKNVILVLEDPSTGEVFAETHIDSFPSPSIETVSDSSRYFVLKIQDPNTGRHAFIGMGFQERSDSFDFNASLQDHYRWEKNEEKMRNESLSMKNSGPKQDFSMKEGESISINFGKKTEKKSNSNTNSNTGFSGGVLLPPPPGPSSRRRGAGSPDTQRSNQNNQNNPFF